MAAYTKPLPRMTKMNRPSWEAAKQHAFTLQKCQAWGSV